MISRRRTQHKLQDDHTAGPALSDPLCKWSTSLSKDFPHLETHQSTSIPAFFNWRTVSKPCSKDALPFAKAIHIHIC